MQLSDLSEMLHWISQFMHLFAKGEAFAASVSIDQRFRGDMSKLHHVRLSLAPKDRRSNIYFPASDAWQVVVKVKHSQSGSFKYLKRNQYLETLLKYKTKRTMRGGTDLEVST